MTTDKAAVRMPDRDAAFGLDLGMRNAWGRSWRAACLGDWMRARAVEARLLEEATAKDERIKELEAAVSAVMDALTTFDGGRVILNMRREEYAKVLAASSVLAKVSP